MERQNTGVLFKNDRKTKDTQPDYTGKWNDEAGNEWQLAAWIKQGQKGKFLSLKASPVFKKEQDRRETAQPVADFDDSEIPF